MYYSKIQITGVIELATGLHIGSGDAISAIGAVDSPVMRDVKSHLPMIPGSSLKGKMRTLLARSYNSSPVDCGKDDIKILRVFGGANKNDSKAMPSRLLVSDMVLSNEQELLNERVDSVTEVKFENTINRQTGVANPRQIERVIRGSKFNIDMIYDVASTQDILDNAEEKEKFKSEILEDMETIKTGLKLLQYDYIGGNGSRGYGKIKISDIEAKVVVGNNTDLIDIVKINEILNLS